MPDLPDGVELQYTHWGEPKNDVVMSATTGAAQGDISPAPNSYIPFEGDLPVDRSKKCRAKDDTCNGWRMRDSDFCPIHAGLPGMRNAERVMDEPR